MYTWGYLKENVLSKLNLTEAEANRQNFLSNISYYANEAMTQICSAIKPKHAHLEIIIDNENLNKPISLPDDFVSFNDDVAKIVIGNEMCEARDEWLEYYGYNQVICHIEGIYIIPYNARWFFFTKDLHNATVIPAPADICDALPSYIVSQFWKIDDESKAAIYRNEFEMFLARMDDTSFKSQRTLYVGGDW